MQSPYAVVMAGGTGTRFWPASRRDRPKQYLPIVGPEPMIARTLGRLEGLVPIERVLVVTTEDQRAAVQEALPDLPSDNIVVEPFGRNTGPCVALAAEEVARRDPDAVQIVLPADHEISPAQAFREVVTVACEEARASGSLLTLGIHPTEASTAYGYIEAGESLSPRAGHEVFAVARFHEKPIREVAEEYLARGGFSWNAGIFVWHTPAIRAAVRKHMPAVAEGLDRWRSGTPLAEVYGAFDSVPIDMAVLEKVEGLRMIPVQFQWSDVGAWPALAEVQKADAAHNITVGGGPLRALDAKNNIVYGEEGHMTALIGVENLVVVHARGATFVCPKDRAQEVKRIVEGLEGDLESFR